MKSTRLLPLAVAAVSFAASAHTTGSLPAVTDPNAPVAPLHYHSVFPESPARDDNQPTPDKVWIRANRELAGETLPAHHANHGTHAAQFPAGARPATRDAKPAADPHHGQHMPPQPPQPPKEK